MTVLTFAGGKFATHLRRISSFAIDWLHCVETLDVSVPRETEEDLHGRGFGPRLNDWWDRKDGRGREARPARLTEV